MEEIVDLCALEVGDPVVMFASFGAVEPALYGRVWSIDGGTVEVVTPGCSIYRCGLLYVRRARAEHVVKLREYEINMTHRGRAPYRARWPLDWVRTH